VRGSLKNQWPATRRKLGKKLHLQARQLLLCLRADEKAKLAAAREPAEKGGAEPRIRSGRETTRSVRRRKRGTTLIRGSTRPCRNPRPAECFDNRMKSQRALKITNTQNFAETREPHANVLQSCNAHELLFRDRPW
jgi:hypothetical protein